MRRELGRDLIASAVDRSILVDLIAALIVTPFWSAPAERSGDGALDRTSIVIQSGVALRLPPHSIKKPLHLNQKGWNGQRMAVSPFDGVNRIRFKGSPEEFRIAECEFRIFKTRFRLQFAIRNSNFVILPGLSARSLQIAAP